MRYNRWKVAGATVEPQEGEMVKQVVAAVAMTLAASAAVYAETVKVEDDQGRFTAIVDLDEFKALPQKAADGSQAYAAPVVVVSKEDGRHGVGAYVVLNTQCFAGKGILVAVHPDGSVAGTAEYDLDDASRWPSRVAISLCNLVPKSTL